ALDAPAGVAVLDARRGAFVVFATVADHRRFDAALNRAIFEGERHQLIGATLLARAESDYVAVVVRGDAAMLVVATDGGARNYGRRLAELADGLAGDPEFAAAIAELDAGVDVVAWLDLSDLARAATPACDSGVPCAATRRLVDLVLGPLDRVAVGASLRPRAVEVSAFAPLYTTAWLMRVLRNAPETPAVIAATPRTPYLLAALSVDVGAALEVVDLALRADGDSLGAVRGAVQEAAGVDLDGDVRGALTGELGVVIAVGPDQAVGATDQQLARQMGIALAAGVTRTDELKTLLERLAQPGGVVRAASGGPGRFELWPSPHGPKLDLGFASGFVAAVSDPAFVERLEVRAADRCFVAQVAHPDLKALLSRSDRAAVVMLPLQGMAPIALGYPTACSVTPDDGWPSDDPGVAAMRGELAALIREDDQAYTDALGALMRERADLSVRLGQSAATAHVEERGLTLTAGQYLDAPLSDTLVAVVDAVEAQVRRREASERRCARMWALDNAIQAARPPSPEAEPAPEADAPTPDGVAPRVP
ncbi:MAG: hypothetical protein CVU56_23840, partial [Deltaproteobacteria bacterium HGW-Deltaproteobacteria-14]